LWGESPDRVTVPTRSLDDLVCDFALDTIDLLKIDIEGAEWDVLPASRELKRVRAIVGEFHRSRNEPPEGLLDCLHAFRVTVHGRSDHWLRFEARRE
jgi:hypothetical protein